MCCWEVLRVENFKIYKYSITTIRVVELLILEVIGLNSSIADIELFERFREYILTSEHKPIYFICFSDARGRLYMRSKVSVQSN
jgi:hypothetical protein